MTDPTVTAARRYSELHSGFQLVTAVEAAIPISWLTLDVVALERKPLPVVEEFVLRLCQQGVNTIPDIAAVLGVDDEVVQTAVAGQLSAETLDYRLVHRPERRGVHTIRLTAAGAKAVAESQTTTPQRVEQPYAFDRLRWMPTEHTKNDVITRTDAQTAGMLFLPSSRTRDVTTQDVSPRVLNSLITESEQNRTTAPSRSASASAQLDVLAVESITRQPRRYLPVVLLVFSALDFDDVRLSIVLDDLVSEPHGDALLKAGGADAIGITVVEPIGEPPLPAELLAQRAPYGAVRGLQKRADNTAPGSVPGSALSGSVTATSDSVTARAELSALTVRAVPTFEHRELLAHALRDARRRFLLIAAHLHDAVVDPDFVIQLEILLRRRGMVAHIAYGPSSPDPDSGCDAAKRLHKLAESAHNLTVVRLREALPSCLIFDDTWINTAFDWLSFRGDPAPAYRREEGTLVRAVSVVNDKYAEAVAVIESNS